MPRIRTGLSERRVCRRDSGARRQLRRSVPWGTETATRLGIRRPPARQARSRTGRGRDRSPWPPGSRERNPWSRASGTRSAASVQKSVEPVARIALSTFTSPGVVGGLGELPRADIARRDHADRRPPPRWTSPGRGARRPSGRRADRISRAVPAMNCQSPLAPARDTASGLNPLSIMAVKASSSGSPLDLKTWRIMPR